MSASESCRTQREALAVEALRRTGRLRLQVRGESMLPTLWPGDVAEIAACSPETMRRGEIVLAFRDDRFFLHRLLAHRDIGSFLMRGDSMPGPDPVLPASALVGRLVGVVRAGKTLSVPMIVRPWSRLLGTLFCYCGPARRLALKVHHRWTALQAGGSDLCDLTSDLCHPETP